MKKIIPLVTVAILFFASSTKAQIQRGNLLVGADIANFQLSLNSGGNYDISLDPKVAFFIKNNLAIGPYVRLDLSGAKDAGTDIGYGVGAFGRYYVNDSTINLLKHARFFAEANVGIEGYNPSVGDNTNGLGIGFGPGFAYFITENIGLETLLKYNGIIGFGSSTTSSALTLSFGFQIYLGSARARSAITNPNQ
ncbi:MAG TPA: hypothetical protein VH396_10765 [Chitinophagaceae bacterium]